MSFIYFSVMSRLFWGRIHCSRYKWTCSVILVNGKPLLSKSLTYRSFLVPLKSKTVSFPIISGIFHLYLLLKVLIFLYSFYNNIILLFFPAQCSIHSFVMCTTRSPFHLFFPQFTCFPAATKAFQ